MRASEKLKTLDGRDWPHPLPPLFDALPQIVAVVDEAERSLRLTTDEDGLEWVSFSPAEQLPLMAALAALDEALKC
jgi:hypothetical protein